MTEIKKISTQVKLSALNGSVALDKKKRKTRFPYLNFLINQFSTI